MLSRIFGSSIIATSRLSAGSHLAGNKTTSYLLRAYLHPYSKMTDAYDAIKVTREDVRELRGSFSTPSLTLA